MDIWWIDESSFNVSYRSNYGYSKIGESPYVATPIKSKNISLLCAISLNKNPYYQIFEGGIDAQCF